MTKNSCFNILAAFILIFQGYAFGQEGFDNVLISVDTNRLAYPEGMHPIIIEWTPIPLSDTFSVQVDMFLVMPKGSSTWPDAIKTKYNLDETIDTISIDSIILPVNQGSPREIWATPKKPDPSSSGETVYSYGFNLSSAHRTMGLVSQPDDCDEFIVLNWNSYTQWEEKNVLNAYEVYQSVNNKPFELLAILEGEGQNNYIVENVQLENKLSFVIRAVHKTNGLESFSNINSPNVNFPGLPNYMKATHTVNNGNKATLFFEIDPLSEVDSFVVKRATSKNGLYNEGVVAYTSDIVNAQAEVNVDDNDYFYKLFAYNKCGKVRDSSNVTHLLKLRETKRDGSMATVEWNQYRGFDAPMNGLLGYQVQGDISTGIITDQNSIVVAVEDTVRLQVLAIENTSDTASSHTSLSNEIVLYPEIKINFKEAYRLGQPVIAPELENVTLDYYEIKVFNRAGIMVYKNTINEQIHTFNPSQKWDGTKNGSLVAPGTYIYHIKYSILGIDDKSTLKGYFILVK